jgi:Cu/Ag efflux protein CusF
MKTARFVRIVLTAAIVLATAAVAGAQSQTQPQTAPRTPAPVGAAGTVTLSATIEAIDSTTRSVTLKGKEGNVVTIICGPEIQRFNELKVGDTVTFQYHEGIVFSIAAPGSTPPPPGTAVVRSGGDRPAGMIAKRETAVVTILAMDPKVPSVTIQKADGGKMSFKVEDPKNLEGVKVGDKVQIVYAQALAVAVK